MKNLPIKLFEKRTESDERLPEAGGSNDLPKWAQLTDAELLIRTTAFKKVLAETQELFLDQDKEMDFIPAVMQLHLNKNATAKSHRSDVSNIFNVNSRLNVIGMTGNQDVLIKINNIDDIVIIEKNLDNISDNKKGIAAITEMTHFVPKVVVPVINDKQLFRASLVNFHDIELNKAVCVTFENYCRKRNIKFRKANYTPDLIIYRLSNVTLDSFDDLVEFRAVESLSNMPTYSVVFDDVGGENNAINIKEPDKERSYPVVGILDSGISPIPHLSPWILPNSFTKVPQDRIDHSHGTFVSGIVVYGDELEGLPHIGNDGCYLFDATIIPNVDIEEIHEDDLVEHIREAVERHHNEVKVWNLSLGTKAEADLENFSPFGMALDKIQEVNEVIIVKSAGNCGNYTQGRPVSRIARSADSLLSLVVGSVAHAKGVHDFADIYHPSPFSRIGKAPAHINKPDLTHLGGNAGLDNYGKPVMTGVTSFSKNGGPSKAIGTSFSTPRVAAIVAGLEHALNEPYNPLLLKALTIHSAKYPVDLTIPSTDRIKYMGYGIPSTIQDILYNDPHEITLVLQDTLLKGNWVQMLDFPFPPAMVENGYFYGEVVLTLVTAPVLSESQGGEYCQSNLLVRFGTHEGIRTRHGKDEVSDRRIRNRFDTLNPNNMLDGGRYKASHRKATLGSFSRERTLIEYEKKYHPVKKYAINLEELTPSNREHLLSPKSWFLEVEDLYRQHSIDRAIEDGVQLSQDYCLIVTIRDNKRQHDIYNSVSQLLIERNFIHSNVRLREETHIRVQ